MYGIVPGICFILFCIAVYLHGSDFRASFLAGSILWGMAVVVLTEGLSWLEGLAFTPLLISWAVVALILISVIISRHKLLPEKFRRQRTADRLSLIIILLTVLFMTEFLIALQAPPNTWDSMTYRMSRVVHWTQHRTVAFYPTHILRQNHQKPFAEWAVLHLFILGRGDRLANLIQWFCMIGSVVGVSLVARELGARKRLQWMAAVVCATIPMGILQSSSTQNDYVAGFWLVCMVYFLIRSGKEHSYVSIIFAGAALGLALLTKGTAYVYSVPFLLTGGILLMRRYPGKGILRLGIIGGIALLINTGHYSRNLSLYGNPLGPGHEGGPAYRYANDTFSLPVTGANIVRNMALHLTTPSRGLNQAIEKSIYRILGKEANNPASTWGGTTFRIRELSFHEDSAGNPLHGLLIMISGMLIMVSRSSARQHRYYVLCLIGTGVLFSAYLRWQPWHSRLHLPLFVLASPVVALGFHKALKTQRGLRYVALGMILSSLPWLLWNTSRPLLGASSVVRRPRLDQYFANRPLMAPYKEAVHRMVRRGTRDIGWICDGDDWEYPFHALLREHYQRDYRFHHFHVQNESRNLSGPAFYPTAVLTTLDSTETDDLLVQTGYSLHYSKDGISLWTRQ